MNLMKGDCLERMKEIPDKSVDMVLTDPPYGTTACKWDSVIPFDLMWKELKRITKDRAAVALFGCEPFSSSLRMSNMKYYRYDWFWLKARFTGNLLAKRQPLRRVETVSIFYRKQPAYQPYTEEINPLGGSVPSLSFTEVGHAKKESQATYRRPEYKTKNNVLSGYPVSERGLHPTQKPVTLLEYLIKTYTFEGETVLDFTMGSGSTGVACVNTGRNFIGIERDDKYFEIAKERIEQKEKPQ